MSYFRKSGSSVAEMFSQPRKRKYLKIISPSLNYIFQSDLLFYKNKIILTTIDIYSRKAYSIIVPNKKAKIVKEAFIITMKYIGKPRVLMVDGGSEFKREFLKYLQSQSIEVRVSGNDSMRIKSIKTKQGIIERYNRTFKDILNNYLIIENKKNFGQKDVEILNEDYNNHVHSSVGDTPNRIAGGVKPIDKRDRNISSTDLDIGMSVRVLMQRGVFEKNSKTKRVYSKEVYYIINQDGNRFQLSNKEWFPYTRLKISKMKPTFWVDKDKIIILRRKQPVRKVNKKVRKSERIFRT